MLQQFAKLGATRPKNTANVLWAVSCRVKEPPEQLGVLLENFLEKTSKGKPQEIANVLLALQRWQQRYNGGTLIVRLRDGTRQPVSKVVDEMLTKV